MSADHPRRSSADGSEPQMSRVSIANLDRADREALDALVEAGFDPRAVPAEHRPRAEKLAQLLAVLDRAPEQKPGDLLKERTLQAVERARQQERFNEQIEQMAGPAEPQGPGLRLRDLVAAAAVFLIGVSVLWPMLSHARGMARQIACQAHLAAAGQGLCAYAAEHNGAMPATRAKMGDPWWLTNQFDRHGNAKSNSAHLFVAAREGYVPLSELSCPENPKAIEHMKGGMRDWPRFAAVSFSYQNQYTRNKPKLQSGPNVAILADKNPFFAPGEFRLGLQRDTNSENHTHRGQNVLLSDGSVAWRTHPRVNGGDNIFHAGHNGLDYYTGLEAPASESDSFLVP